MKAIVNMKDLYAMEGAIFLSDMDGTLTKGSIVLEHAGYLIEKGYIKDDGSYEAWVKDVKNETLIVAVAENYRHQLKGLKVEDLHVKEFIAKQLEDENKWYSTLGLLKQAKENGNRVVIISGSSDFLVEEIASQLGFEGYGSRYLKDEEGKLNGELVGMFGEESKDELINNELLKGEEDKFIVGLGDTSADNGIFKNANYNILVEPTSQTMEHLLQVGARINKIVRQ